MPCYDYMCDVCGDFDVMRRISERDAPMTCPNCQGIAYRIMTRAPFLADMLTTQRHAYATNEKAAHEPKQFSKERHGSGCSCCTGTKTVTHKGFVGKRPWMISH